LRIYWVVIIDVIRCASLGVGFMRYKQLTFLHTYANKLTGIALFSSLFMYVGLGLYTTTILVCFIASISALEELIINTVSKKLCNNQIS
jgi:cardiolipin synthase